MNTRILLIEDEPGLVMTLSDLLETAGYHVETATDGETGSATARSQAFDLVVLDLMLPKKSGFEVCREMRDAGTLTPVLMLTARSGVEDRVSGLKLGADDYLCKPFDPEELLARVEALLRRTRKPSASRSFRFGSVEANFDRAEIRKDGKPVNLAAKELQLLQYLIDHRDRFVTRDEILQNVWQYHSDVSSRTIDVHVAWLRQKLEDEPQSPKYIQTVRGQGYRFLAASE